MVSDLWIAEGALTIFCSLWVKCVNTGSHEGVNPNEIISAPNVVMSSKDHKV